MLPDLFFYKMYAANDTNVSPKKTWKSLEFVMNSQFFGEK